jgi:hypothetical protein
MNNIDKLTKASNMVTHIKDKITDPEEAHVLEDELNAWVIDLLIENDPDARLVAILAVQVRDLKFPRWYA